MKHAHRAVGFRPRFFETPVYGVKFSFLRIFGVVRLGDAHARHGGFDFRVDLRHLFSRFLKGLVHALPRLDGEKQHKRDIEQHDQRQPAVYRAQHHQRSDNGNTGVEHVLGTVVRKLRHLKQVVDNPRHDAARLVLVKKGKGHRLDMAEQIPPHVALYPHAQHVPPISHDKGQNALDGVDRSQNDRPDDQQPKRPVGGVIVHDLPCDHGIEHVAHGNGEGADEIHQKQTSVRLIVGKKSSYQLHSLSLHL